MKRKYKPKRFVRLLALCTRLTAMACKLPEPRKSIIHKRKRKLQREICLEITPVNEHWKVNSIEEIERLHAL